MVTKKATVKETALAVQEPDTTKLSTDTTSIAAQAKLITVTNIATYQKASALIDVGNGLLQEIGATFDGPIKAAHALHKDLIAKKKVLTDPIEAAINAKKREMGNWQYEQDRIRRAEEARLAEEARKQAEALAVAEAQILEQQGQTEAAEEVIQQAIEAPTPTVVLPKFQSSDFGRTTRQVWKWKIVDLSKIPLHFLVVCENAQTKLMQDVSTSAIGALVRTLKNKEMAEAQFKGGVEVWSENSVF
jgi:hypothetical protein